MLTFACDTGNRYLSKMFNDFWMRDQGFLETTSHGDLRDLIARPFESHDTVTIGPDEPLANAYTRMKLYDVSQLPVVARRPAGGHPRRVRPAAGGGGIIEPISPTRCATRW